jgi:hypothetical protein
LWVRFAPHSRCECRDTLWLRTDQPDSALAVVLAGGGAGDKPPRELRFALAGSNPAPASVAFALDLPAPASVELELYDLRGARVRTLADGAFPAGRHRLEWDRHTAAGRRAASGVYFARLRVAGETRRLKLVLIE